MAVVVGLPFDNACVIDFINQKVESTQVLWNDMYLIPRRTVPALL
jgi:hypothetical protein